MCAVSIDLDPIDCYFRIHGLGRAPEHLDGRMVAAAVPRFVEALGRRGVRATFFVVGRQLEGAAVVAGALDAAAAAGHELGNHSHTHPYDLARLPAPDIAAEIERGHAAVSDVAGAAAVGFRAPGYDLPAAAVPVLERLGYRYDSSLFPSPPYYAAKLGVMALMRAARRPSGAVLTDPRALVAPAVPYRMDPKRPWRRGRGALWELPVAVSPRLRLPVIGTSLLMAPRALRRRMLAAVARRPFFNFELHAVDLVDAVTDQIPAELVARQPDLRASLARKRAAFDDVLDWLAARGYEFAPLRDAAAEFAGASA